MTITQIRICEAIARHFRIKKQIVVDKVKEYFKLNGEQLPVFEISIVDEIKYGGSVWFKIGTTKTTTAPNKLWQYDRFKKTSLYVEIDELLNAGDVQCVGVYIGGALLAVSKDTAYAGTGGLLIKENNFSNVGYVFELFENYLLRLYGEISVLS